MRYVRPTLSRTLPSHVVAWREEYTLVLRQFRARQITETDLRGRLFALGYNSDALKIEIADAIKSRQRADPAPPERTAL